MTGPAPHLAAGRAAEEAATAFLAQQGYVPLARNLRCGRAELDIVARDRGTLAIVEVRYRARRDFGGGAASVTAAKQRHVIHATRLLLAREPAFARLPVRFDVVEVEPGDGTLTCRLIRGAFDARP